jgi:hypothetical protein
VGGFTVTYLDAGQVERQEDLTAAATLALEDAPPVRTFPSYHGQRHYPGLWWSATLGRHVGYESWLERDTACMLDFDPGVVAFASQPFWLRWEQDGRACSHVPDWFARLADGTGVVLDCRPADQVRPKDAAVFNTTARACQEVGWRYELVGGHDPVLLANVRWLAGSRHPRHYIEPIASALLAAFAQPRRLLAGAAAAGDPIATLPVLYHLLWQGRLHVDLTVQLADTCLVRPGEEA